MLFNAMKDITNISNQMGVVHNISFERSLSTFLFVPGLLNKKEPSLLYKILMSLKQLSLFWLETIRLH